MFTWHIAKREINWPELVIVEGKTYLLWKNWIWFACTLSRFPFSKLSTSYLPKIESDWNWTTWRSAPTLMQYRCFLKLYGVLNYAKPILTSWILFFTNRIIDSHVKSLLKSIDLLHIKLKYRLFDSDWILPVLF